MSFTVEVSGFRELEQALIELPKSIARNVLVRTLRKAAEPIAEAARAAAPVASGNLRDSIQVSIKRKNKVGKAEYAAAMRAGLGKAAATAALRDARRVAKGAFAEIYIGPASGKGVIRYAHLEEFGTVDQPPHPYMRPAWEAQKRRALEIIRAELGNEIMAAARRLGRSKRYSAEIKYRASIAALLAHEAG